MILHRDGRPDDAGVIDTVYRLSFADTFAHLYKPEDLASFFGGFTLERWERELRDPDRAFRVACDSDDRPVAFAKLAPLTLPVVTDKPALTLDQIYILKSHHGAGIGRQLLEWAFGEARRRGAAELYLTVFIENRRAWRLYEGYGFEPVGRYDFMVGNHADEDIIMRKAL